jgi:amino acid transporter
MEQTAFHKQKLYALIAAGVALVALFLPWISISASFGGAMQGTFNSPGGSVNGMRDWGLLSFAGIIGVAVLTLMGNRALDYTADYRKYVMIAFGAIALGAIIFWAKNNSRTAGGVSEFLEIKVRTGIGLWLCLAAGLGGLALAYGLIKLEDKKPL